MTKTVKTRELQGASLDWAVAQCEGYKLNPQTKDSAWISYSTDWAQGGPIIEREGINLKQWHGAWVAELDFLPDDDAHYRYGKAAGPTPLIAAMRCYVASKMGDSVEIPKEIM